MPLPSGSTIDDLFHQAEKGGMQSILQLGCRGTAALGCHYVLRKVVGADAEEVELGRQLVAYEGSGRNLDHGADLHRPCMRLPTALQLQVCLLEQASRLFGLMRNTNHGKHHPELVSETGNENRAQVRQEEGLVAEGEADTTCPKKRIAFGSLGQEGQRLVGAGIQSTNDRRPLGDSQDFAQRSHLLFLAGSGLAREKEKLGSEQADTFGTAGDGSIRIGNAAYVGKYLDAGSIQSATGLRRRSYGLTSKFSAALLTPLQNGGRLCVWLIQTSPVLPSRATVLPRGKESSGQSTPTIMGMPRVRNRIAL